MTRKDKKKIVQKRVDNIANQVGADMRNKYISCINGGLNNKRSLTATVEHGKAAFALLIEKTPSEKHIYLRAADVVEKRFLEAVNQKGA